MTAELGVFFLIIALFVSLLQSAYLWPALRTLIMPCLRPASWLQALCVTLALVSLMMLRIESDFSVANVAAHSNLSLPLLYKIAGTWGNHEGSMLLWVWVLSVFGAALALQRRHDSLFALAVAVQSALAAGTLLFILFTSNPFERVFPPLPDGQALNPVLQDIALAIHPPLLYVGYVGFSIVFSLSVASLMAGHAARDWAYAAHPWIMASWSALTLGIGLGSWWAYRELGWGGWWFWDPVENASLLPWLSGTALLHSNVVLKKRGQLAQWVHLLAIITFGLSLIGTFLVRSGALTSVHSFASDPARGVFILVYIVLAVGGALLLFARRAGHMQSEEMMLPVSREGMIVINNLFLLTACATVLLGTLYPLAAEWLSGEKLTVGPPYFNATFLPLMFLPLLFAGLALLMPWQKASMKRTLISAMPAILASGAAIVIVLAVVKTHLLYALCGFGLATWLAACSLLRRQMGSVFIAHLGAAAMVAGITGAGLWKMEVEGRVAPGETIEVGGYTLLYEHPQRISGQNYHTLRSTVAVSRNGKSIATLAPEYRVYSIRGSITSEAAIHSSWFDDVYVVIGDKSPDDGRISTRAYYVPMIRFIWLGFVLMALGGLISMFNKKVKYLGRH